MCCCCVVVELLLLLFCCCIVVVVVVVDWPSCLFWHGWLLGFSLAGERDLWAASVGQLASRELERCVGAYPADNSSFWTPPDFWDADDSALEMTDTSSIPSWLWRVLFGVWLKRTGCCAIRCGVAYVVLVLSQRYHFLPSVA